MPEKKMTIVSSGSFSLSDHDTRARALSEADLAKRTTTIVNVVTVVSVSSHSAVEKQLLDLNRRLAGETKEKSTPTIANVENSGAR